VCDTYQQGGVPGRQTIGYSVVDSPLGLAAWMLDHDADSYEKTLVPFWMASTQAA
jgi:hypothetical protein